MQRLGFEKAVWAILVGVSLAATVAGSAEDPHAPTSVTDAMNVQPLDIEWTTARECWHRIARIDSGAVADVDIGRRALDRFFESAHARELVIDLCSLFSDSESGATTSIVTVRFVDEMPTIIDLPDGSFDPPRRGARLYEVRLRLQPDHEVFDRTTFIFGQYPDNPNCAYTFYYQQGVSAMAQALYHELLHIWYLNKYAGVGRRYPTGHGLVTLCEFEDDFLELLAANAAELSTIEGHPPLNFGSAVQYNPTTLEEPGASASEVNVSLPGDTRRPSTRPI
jgi:hypothetical protein